jgi:hypothetical protein
MNFLKKLTIKIQQKRKKNRITKRKEKSDKDRYEHRGEGSNGTRRTVVQRSDHTFTVYSLVSRRLAALKFRRHG